MMPNPDETQEEFFFAPEATRRDLILGTGKAAKLRPSQEKFNQALKRLRKAQARLEEAKDSVRRKKEEYCTRVLPVMREFNRAVFDWINAAIDRYQAPRAGLSDRQMAFFLDLIVEQLDTLQHLRHGIEPEEMEQLVARLDEIPEADDDDDDLDDDSSRDFHGMGAAGRSAFGEVLEGFFREDGLDVDLSDIDPDDIGAVEARVEQAMRAAEGGGRRKGRKRSARQNAAAAERDRLAREKEQAKLRDFKALFKSLAKAMHPDLVTEPDAKAHREDWMKRLTSAYEQQDLHSMLTIEMEWLGSESKDLAAASDQKLAIYSELLREQALEVEEQLRVTCFEDPFLPYSSPFSREPPGVGELCGMIQTDTEKTLRETEELKQRGKSGKRVVARLVQESYSRRRGFGF